MTNQSQRFTTASGQRTRLDLIYFSIYIRELSSQKPIQPSNGRPISPIQSKNMPIDFQLSASEDAIRKHAAAFAAGPLKDIKKHLFRKEGRTTISGIGAFSQRILGAIFEWQRGTIGELVFSEPGGVANFVEKGAPGLITTATREGDEWVLNGEKMWATNCAVSLPMTPADAIMVLLVSRADIERNQKGAFKTLKHIPSVGHPACSGPHIKYTNLRVPTKNVLAPPGEGLSVVLGSFDCSAVLVGAMSVSVMRAAFDAALAFAKKDNRRGAEDLLSRQAFADLLSGIKMKAEASRALTWRAAYALEHGPGDYDARRELALAAKIYCSEESVKAVTDAINAVGVTAYSSEQPFVDLLNTAIVLPIFDGGNVGVRRRNMQQLMASKSYDPWASTFGPSQSS
ncbi:hypothetical protein EYC84_001938 [Monilinia fructicola]|uniref:Acyl-CoA dehydrogenase/oxidase C-terminal domain-containing protein n=1 Tax=Monilinia fructicola TaxID=38448 RepID=A0A5M9JU76_MONFR|nr:hypothetical protein EYC84_001938 [Monilinia fructicola]